MCALLVGIGMFLIPIEAIIWIVVWIKYRKYRVDAPKANHVLNFFAIFTFIICFSIFVFSMNYANTCGVTTDIQVQTVDEKYYIMINDNMVELSKEQANKIKDPKQSYCFEYKHNNFIQGKSTMTYFEEVPQ